MSTRILAFPRYSALGASSRMRFYQFAPALNEAGFMVGFQPLINERALLRKYCLGKYSRFNLLGRYLHRIQQMFSLNRVGLIWIEKESLPWMPSWLEICLLAGYPYVLDFDDAVFHNYDLHSSSFVRYLMGNRIDRLMANARLVTVGNEYLAARARQAGAAWVEVIPTVVDMERYNTCIAKQLAAPLRVVWIGSPTSVQYLLEISAALTKLSELRPFVLRVIGGGRLEIPGLQVECLEWSEDTEVSHVKECHVGIMPLRDTPWERGKCAYKLIQYMASGLPTVAAAVGANYEVVIDGETGFLVSTEDQWVEKLLRLLDDSGLRQDMGRAGHLRAAEHYSLQVMGPRLAKLLQKVGEA